MPQVRFWDLLRLLSQAEIVSAELLNKRFKRFLSRLKKIRSSSAIVKTICL